MLATKYNEQTPMVGEFKIGDMVRLISGSPLMTINSFDDSRTRLCCVWFIDADIHIVLLRPETVFSDIYRPSRIDCEPPWIDLETVNMWKREYDEMFSDDPYCGCDCEDEEYEFGSDTDDEGTEVIEKITVGSFKIGDEVRLISGGPLMTINSFDDSRTRLCCVWFIDFAIHSALLRPETVFSDFGPSCINRDTEIMRKEKYDEMCNGDHYCDCEDEEDDSSSDTDDESKELMEEIMDDSEDRVLSKRTGWYYDD